MNFHPRLVSGLSGALAVGLLAFFWGLSPGASASPSPDPLSPPSTGGLAAVDRGLAKLSGHQRLLVIGAHPDDEDTSLLALVARTLGGEAAYLSLSRGEGGQNLIGTELGVGLGLLRSQELLSARRIDGARQFFTRAYDFGYTRSLEETLRRWPREALLEDALRVVRTFRPQVIVSVFPPDPQAGHGQHQAAGVIAGEVYRRAADPEAAPRLDAEGLAPHHVQALYRAGFFDRQAEALQISLGVVDPLDGRSVAQLARASRSQHRSQDMGSLQQLGAPGNRIIPLEGSATLEGADPFAGIDTRLRSLAAPLPEGQKKNAVTERLDRVEALARAARENLSAVALGEAVAPLAEVLGLLEEARGLLEGGEPRQTAVAGLLSEKILVASEALTAAAGIAVDAYGEGETLVPGVPVEITVEAWNSSGETVEVEEAALEVPEGWRTRALEGGEGEEGEISLPSSLAAGELGSRRFQVTVPQGTPPRVPYFLERPLEGDLYDWSATPPEVRGAPFAPPPVRARFRFAVAGRSVELVREAVYRYGDQAVGEIRRPFQVRPRLEVEVDDTLTVWPVGSRESAEVTVRVRNLGPEAAEGRLRVVAPDGWPVPPERPFRLAADGDQEAFLVTLEAPPDLEAGDHLFRFEAVAGGETFAGATPLVEYPHVRPTPLPRPSELLVRAADLKLPEAERIGYVRGASDRVPELLSRLGLPLEELSAESLSAVDLGTFDVLVIGSRAYETDPALAQANERLLEYVREGGRLVVQYQQYQFVRGGFAPYPLEIERPHARVTDETAPVTALAPGHPFLNRPNVIGAEDWSSWVQERGLYFPSTWDEAYTPLLAMADPQEPERRGGLLVARLGEGEYVYTGLAFFRQLPAGVIGSYRLFLNLLSGSPAAASSPSPDGGH